MMSPDILALVPQAMLLFLSAIICGFSYIYDYRKVACTADIAIYFPCISFTIWNIHFHEIEFRYKLNTCLFLGFHGLIWSLKQLLKGLYYTIRRSNRCWSVMRNSFKMWDICLYCWCNSWLILITVFIK